MIEQFPNNLKAAFSVNNTDVVQVRVNPFEFNSGSKAMLQLDPGFVDYPGAGDSFIIRIPGLNYEREFIAGTHFDKHTGQAHMTYWTDVLQQLSTIDLTLFLNYNLYYSTELYFEAKNFGTQYNIELVQGGSYTFVSDTATPGVNQTIYDNHKVVLSVFHRKNFSDDPDNYINTFGKMSKAVTFQNQGLVQFDVNRLLRSLDWETSPQSPFGGCFQSDNHAHFFVLRAHEEHGVPAQEMDFITLNTSYGDIAIAVNSSFHPANYSGFPSIDILDSELGIHTLGQKWWYQCEKSLSLFSTRVRKGQPVILSTLWMYPQDITNTFELRCTVYLKDGTDFSFNLLQTNYNGFDFVPNDYPDTGKLVTFNVAAQYLLRDYAAIWNDFAQVDRISVQMFTNNSPVTDEAILQYDQSNYLNEEYLLFKNMWGAYQVFPMLGNRIDSKEPGINYVDQEPSLKDYSVFNDVEKNAPVATEWGIGDKKKIFTHYMSNEEADIFDTLISSPEVYILSNKDLPDVSENKGPRWLPVKITASNVDRGDVRTKLRSGYVEILVMGQKTKGSYGSQRNTYRNYQG